VTASALLTGIASCGLMRARLLHRRLQARERYGLLRIRQWPRRRRGGDGLCLRIEASHHRPQGSGISSRRKALRTPRPLGRPVQAVRPIEFQQRSRVVEQATRRPGCAVRNDRAFRSQYGLSGSQDDRLGNGRLLETPSSMSGLLVAYASDQTDKGAWLAGMSPSGHAYAPARPDRPFSSPTTSPLRWHTPRTLPLP